MGMSQIMIVQPLLDAGKGANTNAGNKSSNSDLSNPFQSMLQGKIELQNDKPIEVHAAQNKESANKQTSSSANENQQSSEPKPSAEAKNNEENSKVAKEESPEEDLSEEVMVSVDDATILAQIMASAVGAQIVPVEPIPNNVTAELVDEKSFLVSDESIIVDGKSTLKNAETDLATVRNPVEVAQTNRSDLTTTRNPAESAQTNRSDLTKTRNPEELIRETDSVDYSRVQTNATQSSQESFSDIQSSATMNTTSTVTQSVTMSAQPTEVVINPSTEPSVAEIQQFQPVVQAQQVGIEQQQVPINQIVANSNPVESRIMQQLGTPEWEQAIGQRIVWMVGQTQQSASLTLNPPELGLIRVVVNLSNNNADANFYSANPDVRTALEGTLPRLKEIMEGAGIQLGQAHVGSEDSQNQQFNQTQTGQVRVNLGGNEDEMSTAAATAGQEVVKTTVKGIVDTFV